MKTRLDYSSRSGQDRQARTSGSPGRGLNMMSLENISHFTHHVVDCIWGAEILQFDVLLTSSQIKTPARLLTAGISMPGGNQLYGVQIQDIWRVIRIETNKASHMLSMCNVLFCRGYLGLSHLASPQLRSVIWSMQWPVIMKPQSAIHPAEGI